MILHMNNSTGYFAWNVVGVANNNHRRSLFMEPLDIGRPCCGLKMCGLCVCLFRQFEFDTCQDDHSTAPLNLAKFQSFNFRLNAGVHIARTCRPSHSWIPHSLICRL